MDNSLSETEQSTAKAIINVLYLRKVHCEGYICKVLYVLVCMCVHVLVCVVRCPFLDAITLIQVGKELCRVKQTPC